MVRPKGGRAQPRYHHLKEAAEEKLTHLMDRRRPRISTIDIMIQNLHHTDEVIKSIMEKIELDLMVAALMR